MTRPLPGATEDRRPITVFVHLARGFDARTWEAAWHAGTLIGFNARTPYAYHLAEDFGFRVRFSKDRPEGAAGRLLRLALRAMLGFDLVHAWRNWHEAVGADAIWTHTESQFLAFALLLWASRSGPKPKLLGQAVWLIDRWPRYSPLHRALYRALLRRVDILTLHSPDNLAQARALFPRTRSELVLFGIPTDRRAPPREPRAGASLQVVAIGNDEHRDWDTLLAALGGRGDCSLRIVTATLRPERGAGYANVRIGRVVDNAELHRIYREADLLVVPLKPNHHASGNTVMQEAALSGLPMVASDTGGLQAYFPSDAVRYVRPGDASGLAEAVGALLGDPETRGFMARLAGARMGGAGLGAQAYIRRHIELTFALLAGDPVTLSVAEPGSTVSP